MTYANTALCVNTHIQTIQTQVLQASISNITNLKKVGLYSLYMRIWGKSLSDKAVCAPVTYIKKVLLETFVLYGSQALDFASAWGL